MDFVPIVVCVLCAHVTLSLVAGGFAHGRGHNFWPFFLLSLMVTCVVAMLLAGVITPAKKSVGRSRHRPGRRSSRRSSRRGRDGKDSKPDDRPQKMTEEEIRQKATRRKLKDRNYIQPEKQDERIRREHSQQKF